MVQTRQCRLHCSSPQQHFQHSELRCTNTVPAQAHLMAYLQARWQISVMSAPEKPLVCLTRASTSTSSATGDLRRTALKIWRRLPSSGKGM